MADDKKDAPKSRGEELAEKLAGSNPVESKSQISEKEAKMDPPADNEPVPPSPPPTQPPVESGPADVMNTKAVDAKAAQKAAVDAPTKPKSYVEQAAEKKAAEDKAKADKRAAEKAAEKAEDERREAERRAKLPPDAPPWYRTLRADPPFYIRMALGAGMVALVFALWWFLTRGAAHEAIISPSKLVSPGATFGATKALLERDLLDNIIDTLQRVLLGIGLAAIVGVTLGVLSGAHRGVSAALAPLVIFLRSVPMGALLPLTLIMFGGEEKQKWLFIFLAVVPFVFSDALKAISSVPDRYIETAQTLGATKRQIVMKVLVPLAMPDITTSLRFQLGLALGYITLAEAGSTFVEHGLGKMIQISQTRALPEHVFLLLFVITLLAFSIDLLLRTLQRGVFPWRKDL